jgi:predicted dehydrogenase
VGERRPPTPTCARAAAARNLRVVTDALVRRVTPPLFAEGALVAEGALGRVHSRARRASTSTSPASPATPAHDARSSSAAARSTPRSC